MLDRSLALRLKNRVPHDGERGRNEENDARAIFLSNTAEERHEAPRMPARTFLGVPDGTMDAATMTSTNPAHVYEIRPRKDERGFDLISDALPFGALWYGEPNAISNAIGYAKFCSRSRDAIIRVYNEAGNVIETHEHKGHFKEW
jgi:hypothetical protein